MRIDVREESMASMEAYARISTAFRVERQFVLSSDPSMPSGVRLDEASVASPFIKDYDALPDNHPTDWSRRPDSTRWCVFAAFVGDVRVGGAILIPADAHASDRGVAELWDLRVEFRWRRRGVARALWATVEAAAVAGRASMLDIETQQINVAACQFYAANGCVLVGVDESAYPLLPDEVGLRWRKVLPSPDGAD
jgi:GNAT superfamily N-acetyltransferase